MASPTQRNNSKRGLGDPWFRINTLDVTTSVLIPLLVVVVWIGWALAPNILEVLSLSRLAYRQGFVWQLVTWPIAQPPGLLSVFGMFFFWSFGRMLEENLGPTRFLRLLITNSVVVGILALAFDAIFRGGAPSLKPTATTTIPGTKVKEAVDAGKASVQFAKEAHDEFLRSPILSGLFLVSAGVALAAAIEFPGLRSFFGIPLRWLVAGVLFIQVLLLVGSRSWLPLLYLVLLLVVVISTMKAFGLGSDMPPQIPNIPAMPLPIKWTMTRQPGSVRSTNRNSAGKKGSIGGLFNRKSSGDKPAKAPRQGKVVTGPWGESGTGSATDAAAPIVSSAPIMSRTDREEVDRLLDKIAKDGMTSLSSEERAQLEAASRRLRENGNR